jgi:carboxypeptidase C (cathepsin A)
LPLIRFFEILNNLPAIAATAWYHKKSGARLLNKTLDEVLQEVRIWAQNDYLRALWHGNNLTNEERDAVVKRLADYTGLPEDYIRSNNLRINGFSSKLFEGQRLWISLYDGRITGPEGNDPLFPMTFPALAMAFDTHLRKDLGYQTDRYYNTLSFDVGRDWTYRSKQGRYTYTGDDLASALKNSRYLKVFSASGIYDLIVPYDEVLFELHQMDIPPAIIPNIQAKSYPGGHMPYLDKIARKQLISDLRVFYKGALMNWSSAK